MENDFARRNAEYQVRLARYARKLSAEMFPEGLPEGMTFTDLERAAVKVGDEVSRTMIESQVRARVRSDADRPPQDCPKCGGPLAEGAGQARELATTRGDVAWTETTQHCPRCRRAFSPSQPRVGA